MVAKKRRKKEKKKEKEKFFQTIIVCALEAFEVKQRVVVRRKRHKLKMMPNQNRPVSPIVGVWQEALLGTIPIIGC